MRFSNSNPTNDVAGAGGLPLVPMLGVGTHRRRRSASLGTTQSVETGRFPRRAWEPGQSPIPNPQSLIPRSRRGFTLIEMLIVIGIMLILVAAVATIMPSATESRRMRESARSVNIYLSSARNEAMASGRACGVTFHYLGGGVPCALTADQCKEPPPRSGDTDTSTATITYPGTGNRVSVVFSDGRLTNGVFRPGDIMQFNAQGPFYTIADSTINPVDDKGYLKDVGDTGQPLIVTFDNSQGQIVPWTTNGSTASYSIRPSLTKSGATPLQLPTGTVVDLDFSSSGYNLGSGQQDFTVVFSPTGGVKEIYYGGARLLPTDPVYILIGRRERVGTFTPLGQTPPATKVESQFTNVEDLGNLWVTINPQTGLINTEPLADGATAAANIAYTNAKGSGKTDEEARAAAMLAAMDTARNLARQAIGMGGK